MNVTNEQIHKYIHGWLEQANTNVQVGEICEVKQYMRISIILLDIPYAP